MKKIENYINYIFTGYPDNLKVQELKDELTTNLIDRANDYIKQGKDENEAVDLAINNLGDINEILESVDLKQSKQYFSEQINDYLKYLEDDTRSYKKYSSIGSKKLVMGIMFILLAVSFSTFISMKNEMLSGFVFLVGAALAVPLFVLAGFDFSKANSKTSYSLEQISEFDKEQVVINAKKKLIDSYQGQQELGKKCLVFGISLSIMAVALPFLFDKQYDSLGSSFVLLVLAFAVPLIVFGGIKLSTSQILNDNYKYELKQKQQDDSFAGIIFIIGVIIFLIVGFSLNAWHPGWIIFPVCALIVMIYESTNKFKH